MKKGYSNKLMLKNTLSCNGLGGNLRYMGYFDFRCTPRKKNLVAIMSWGHVLGSWKTMFD